MIMAAMTMMKMMLFLGHGSAYPLASVQILNRFQRGSGAAVRNDSIGQRSQEASDGDYCPNVTRHYHHLAASEPVTESHPTATRAPWHIPGAACCTQPRRH